MAGGGVRNPRMVCFYDGDTKRSNIAHWASVSILQTGTRVMELDDDDVYYDGGLYCKGVGWAGL